LLSALILTNAVSFGSPFDTPSNNQFDEHSDDRPSRSSSEVNENLRSTHQPNNLEFSDPNTGSLATLPPAPEGERTIDPLAPLPPVPTEDGQDINPLSKLPPLPRRGEKTDSRSYRIDHGQIQEYLSEAEMMKIRDGYSPNNALALACFKHPQSQSIKNAIAKNPKGYYSGDTRRTRITVDEWKALRKLRGEDPDYTEFYKGNIDPEDRKRGNSFLVARLQRLRNGDKSRNRRPKTGGARTGGAKTNGESGGQRNNDLT
jgi:hypothetical protein